LAQALERAGLDVRDVDAIFVSTVTGVAAPSIDARLFHRMGLRDDIVRVPMFGLGCVAGAAGLSRVRDWLQAWPTKVAVLVCVELCSLTLQREDLSIANLISSGLFGDGAGAVVCLGDQHPRADAAAGPRVVASAGRLYPDSLRIMGWDIGANGFKVVLDRSVPDVVDRYLRDDVDRFLAAHHLTRADIGSWVCHPGGPKVLLSFEAALEIPRAALQRTWDSLRQVGNLSSASVLFVLEDTIRNGKPEPGTPGMLLALGPGFCAELVLLQW
jgi:alkylresorcinol/alkylpyrone synthase